jgi:hypothetical protein
MERIWEAVSVMLMSWYCGVRVSTKSCSMRNLYMSETFSTEKMLVLKSRRGRYGRVDPCSAVEAITLEADESTDTR